MQGKKGDKFDILAGPDRFKLVVAFLTPEDDGSKIKVYFQVKPAQQTDIGANWDNFIITSIALQPNDSKKNSLNIKAVCTLGLITGYVKKEIHVVIYYNLGSKTGEIEVV